MAARLKLWHLIALLALTVLALDRLLPPASLRAWQVSAERRTGLPGFNALFYQHPASRPGDWLVVSTYFDICLHRQLYFKPSGTIACMHIGTPAEARAALLDDPRTRFAMLRPEEVGRWFPAGEFDAAYRPAFASDGFTMYERR